MTDQHHLPPSTPCAPSSRSLTQRVKVKGWEVFSMETARQFFKFGIIGGLAFGVDAAMLYVGIDILGLGRIAAALFSFPFAVTFTWIGNRLFTFRDTAHMPAAKQWAKFALVCAIGLIFNRGTYSLLVSTVPFIYVHPVIGLMAGSAAGMFFNFFAARRHVFGA